jgi:hypothetical protein
LVPALNALAQLAEAQRAVEAAKLRLEGCHVRNPQRPGLDSDYLPACEAYDLACDALEALLHALAQDLPHDT